jgi:hypothetical protein
MTALGLGYKSAGGSVRMPEEYYQALLADDRACTDVSVGHPSFSGEPQLSTGLSEGTVVSPGPPGAC